MTNFIRTTSLAATVAFLAAAATPALAVTGPTPVSPDKQAKATATIVKPLTMTWVSDLDLGTIVLSGASPFTGAAVSIDQTGTLTCTDANLTCSGPVKSGQYTVTRYQESGGHRQLGPVTLTNAAAGSTLVLTSNARLASTSATRDPRRRSGSAAASASTTRRPTVSTREPSR